MDIINNSVLRLLYEHRYIFAFLGALLEGTFIMVLSGVLFKLGYFNLWGLLAVLVGGYFLNGVFWYLLGRIGGHTIIEKWIKKLKPGRKIIDKLEEYFNHYSLKTIFWTRITYGVSMFVFMIAGSLKMKFKKFATVSFVAAMVWVLILGTIGFGFGAGLKSMARVTKGITFGITIVIFVLIVLASVSFVYWLRYFAGTQFVKDLEEHDSPILSRIGEFIRRAFHHKNKKSN
jgi:membrane protein DedA with SNARE-associated domain